MAVTTIHGYRGKAVFDTTDYNVTEWSATITVDDHIVTPMSAAGVSHTRVLGLTDWTASISGPALEAGPTDNEGTAATLDLWLTNTQSDGSIKGPAILLNVEVSQDQSDAGRIVYNFQGNGTPVWTVA